MRGSKYCMSRVIDIARLQILLKQRRKYCEAKNIAWANAEIMWGSKYCRFGYIARLKIFREQSHKYCEDPNIAWADAEIMRGSKYCLSRGGNIARLKILREQNRKYCSSRAGKTKNNTKYHLLKNYLHFWHAEGLSLLWLQALGDSQCSAEI